jgi:hypothetical protein
MSSNNYTSPAHRPPNDGLPRAAANEDSVPPPPSSIRAPRLGGPSPLNPEDYLPTLPPRLGSAPDDNAARKTPAQIGRTDFSPAPLFSRFYATKQNETAAPKSRQSGGNAKAQPGANNPQQPRPRQMRQPVSASAQQQVVYVEEGGGDTLAKVLFFAVLTLFIGAAAFYYFNRETVENFFRPQKTQSAAPAPLTSSSPAKPN